MTDRHSRILLLGCFYLLAYVALDYISYVNPYRGLGVTSWNPHPGLSLAVIFLGGTSYVPFVLLAPALAGAIVRDLPLGLILECFLSISIGGIYSLAGIILQRWRTFDPRLRSVRDAVILIGASIASASVAALVTATVFLGAHVVDRSEVATVIWRATVGDLIGILVVVPLLFLVFTHRPWSKLGMTAVWQAVALLAALVMVFGYREATAFQLFYLLFLPVLWVALSDGPPGTAVALLLVQIGLIVGAEIRFGSEPGLGALQALMIALAMTGLIVSSLVAEREDAGARLREQQAALNRALRIRSTGEIAATIAHEINQPLTAVNTYAGIAAQAMIRGQSDLAASAVAKIEKEGARAAAVLSSIKEFLRQGTLSREPVDLPELLSELGMLLREDLAKKNISLEIDGTDDVPLFSADRIHLQQAIHNLIVNSADAIQGVGRSGHISVSARVQDDDDCVIEVADNGPGFPPGFNIQDPSPFTTTKVEGSGLGLGVARSIVEAHGGSFKIASSTRGATVTLRIPMLEAESVR